MSDIALRKQFRTLLVNIGSRLNSKNSRQLRFIYEYQASAVPVQDTDGLDVLEQLMTHGEFDAYSPEKLQDVLESISRKDFSEAIKDYKKSSAFKAAMKEKKKGKTMHQPQPVDEGLMVPVQLQPVHYSTSLPDKPLGQMVLQQMTKTIEVVIECIETIAKDDSKKLEVHGQITAMKTEMAALKKMIPETKKEKVPTGDNKSKQTSKKGPLIKIKHAEDMQDRARSNSLDSKLRNPSSQSKGLPDIHSHLQMHKPVPTVAILCSELCEKLREQNTAAVQSSDSGGSNTSSGSSIASQEGSANTPERYVKVPSKNDTKQDSGKGSAAGGSCPSGDQITQDEPVYDEPNRKPAVRPYVNISVLPLHGYSTIQDDKVDQPQEYANIPPKTSVEYRH